MREKTGFEYPRSAVSQQDAEIVGRQQREDADDMAGDEARDETHKVIPVTAEEMEVSKKRVPASKVRITKEVSERTETIDTPGFREEVEVERVPVNQLTDTLPEVRMEGDTTIIPVVEEVLVVEKRYLVKEEVRVRRSKKEVRNPQQVTLRSDQVKIERLEEKGE